MKADPLSTLRAQLSALQLPYVREHFESAATLAAQQQLSHIDFLARLIEGEVLRRDTARIARRIKQSRMPVIKTLDQFDWSWPKKINRMQVQNLFRLQFIEQNANVFFLGNVGLGKTHLALALGHHACTNGHTVLYTTAADIINSLSAAQQHGGVKRAMARYVKPRALIIDEFGYLPIDKFGADCLFQIISQPYERGATIFTSNRVFKRWAEIFNNDITLTSALLDRLLHHAETITIEGKSFRTNEQLDA